MRLHGSVRKFPKLCLLCVCVIEVAEGRKDGLLLLKVVGLTSD